ncbi:MAG: hypothetical protein Q7R76_01045 [Candidatus Woesearchaeota archaeon]|nr:hypothetical protein [Candidatus Woesearchaeota archaeon]
MIQNCLGAYKKLWHNKKSALLIMLSDLLFFLSFTGVFYLLQEQLSTLFLSISQLLAMAGTPTGSGQEAAQEFLSKFPLTTFIIQFAEVIKLFSILILAGVALWIIFQGVAWKKSYAIARKKGAWRPFYGRFFLTTLGWSVIFLLTLILAVKVSSYQLMNVFPVLQTIIQVFFGAVFGILTYLGFVSYCLLTMPLLKMVKKTFVVAYKQFFPLFPLFVLILFKIYLALWLVKNSLAVALWLPLVLFLFLFLPVIAWSRIVFLLALKK